MGSLIAGHILSEEAQKEKLNALPNSVGWRLFRDAEFGVPCLDTFSSIREIPAPFSSRPTKRDFPPVIPADLKIISTACRAFESLNGAGSLDKVMLVLNLKISNLLHQRICTFCSDDDGLDFACISTNGILERLVCGCEDLEFVYANGTGTIQSLTTEIDEDVPYLTDLGELAAITPGITILERNKDDPTRLHGLVSTEVMAFIGKDCLPLGIGTWDLLAVPPTLIASNLPLPAPEKIPEPLSSKRPWWKFW
jgi:hypothetical protein